MSDMSFPSRGMYTFWLFALILLWMVNRRTSRLPFSVNLGRIENSIDSHKTLVPYRSLYVWSADWKHLLWWFLHGPVGVKGLELLLDSHQRVCKLAIVQDDDGLLDPLQEIRRQRFIFLNHLLSLNGVIKHLETKKLNIRYQKTDRRNFCRSDEGVLDDGPFRYVCLPPSRPSSWRNNGSTWRHMWWRTSHRDDQHWYL